MALPEFNGLAALYAAVVAGFVGLCLVILLGRGSGPKIEDDSDHSPGSWL